MKKLKDRGWEVILKRDGRGSHNIWEITTQEGLSTTITITNRPPPIETIEKQIWNNIGREDRLEKERDNEVEDTKKHKKENEMARTKTQPVSMSEVETLTLQMDRMKEEFRNLYQ